jgi:hypothetical protein
VPQENTVLLPAQIDPAGAAPDGRPDDEDQETGRLTSGGTGSESGDAAVQDDAGRAAEQQCNAT